MTPPEWQLVAGTVTGTTIAMVGIMRALGFRRNNGNAGFPHPAPTSPACPSPDVAEHERLLGALGAESQQFKENIRVLFEKVDTLPEKVVEAMRKGR